METRLFDTMTKSVAATRSRRGLLKALAAAGLAGLVGRRAATAAASSSGHGGVCHPADPTCLATVRDARKIALQACRAALSRAADHKAALYIYTGCLLDVKINYDAAEARCEAVTCDAGLHCLSGLCCAHGEQVCPPGVCTDVDTDPANCGGCGNACANGAPCVNGTCQCGSDQHKCGHDCCSPNQVCCHRVCCAHGITACAHDGTCGGGCGQYLLANASGACIDVDDDLTVYLNGNSIFTENDIHQDCDGPIPFTAAKGDQLRITAVDSFGVCHGLDAVTLSCADGSASQVLTGGVVRVCDGAPAATAPFFDQTFTIAI
jgi:hypothetical protein